MDGGELFDYVVDKGCVYGVGVRVLALGPTV